MAFQAEAAGLPLTGPAHRLIENQNRLVGWQIVSERASFALKTLTGFVGIAAFVTVAVVLWSATQYRGLTVQPFSVSSELEADGMTGEVAAQRLLDRLADLQRRTDSARAPNSFANSWGDDITVEIPQTGVSVGELWRFLRAWLGEEVKITGEVVRVNGIFQVVVRAGGHATPTVQAENGDVEAALERAAEALFAQTQPYRYAVHLWSGLAPEKAASSIPSLEALILNGDAMDRKWAFSGLVAALNYAGRFEEALERGRQGVTYAPYFAHLRANVATANTYLGRDEAALIELEEGVRIGSRPGDYSPLYAELVRSIEGEALLKRRDLARALIALRRAADSGEPATPPFLIEAHLAQRDIATAGEIYAFIPMERRIYTGVTMRDLIAFWTGFYLEDWDAVLNVCRTVESLRSEMAPYDARNHLTVLVARCVQAALATGAVAEAKAMVADLPVRSPYLIAAEAGVAAAQGDRAGAERLFAEASAAAPSLPDADLAWGRARLARGEADGAIERFREAARRAPRWADPLKFHADALMAKRDPRGAARLYRQAARKTPRWGGLHLAWGRALEAAGNRRGAQVRYREASGMDLNPADAAEIRRCLA